MRLGVDLHAQPAGRLINQVDCFVGQETVGDIALAEDGRRHHRAVRNAHTVMHFVALLETAQDTDRIFHARLVDKDGLEASFQGGIFLDMFAIFIQRRRANRMQFAACQHGLEHVRGVHCPFRGAGPNQGMHFVDKENDLAFGAGHFFEHRFQTFLKFAAVFGASDQRTEIQRHQLFIAQTGRYIAIDNALRQPFDNCRLTDTWFTDQHRVVLGAPAQDLDHAPNLLVTANHRVEFAFARFFGQVAAILGQRFVLAFWIISRDALVAAHTGQRLHNGIIVDAMAR